MSNHVQAGLKAGGKTLWTALALSASTMALGGTIEPTVDETGVTYTLNQAYEPYLTKTDTLIWPNRKLADFLSMTAINKGGWMSATKADAYIYNRTADSFMVQFQADDGLCKTVRAYFTQEGDDVYCYADKAGYDTSDWKYRELPESKFNVSLATSDSGAGYGTYHIEAFGDALGEIDGLPETDGTITVNGGTLQVNVSSDITCANALAGTGGFLFKGTGGDVAQDVSFAWPSKTAQTLVKNTLLADVEIGDAVLDGAWCGRHEGAKPYNVTTNAAAGTVTAQFQVKWWDNGGWWACKAVGIELRQSGLDVSIKALWAATPINDLGLGSDASQWDTWSVPVVTSSDGGGYGLDQMTFKVKSKSAVKLSGTKTFKGGLVSDGALVSVAGSQTPDRTYFAARNGGILSLDVGGDWNYHSRTFKAEGGSKLCFTKGLACYQDTVLLDDSEMQISDHSTYVNNLTLRNGSRMTGTKVRQGLYSNVKWTAEGDVENVIYPQLALLGNGSVEFTVNAQGNMAFLGGVKDHDDGNSPYMKFKKTGPGTLRIANAEWKTDTGMTFTMDGGKLAVEANLTAGPLVVTGESEISIADGVQVIFADSFAQAWTAAAGKCLNFTGTFGKDARKVRIGTSVDGITAGQRHRLRINGQRAHLDAEGWLQEGALGGYMFVR